MNKPKIAVHKFSSCDGCQLAFLNLGEALLSVFEMTDIIHFAEAGPFDETSDIDVSFVEGSITSEEDIKRIIDIRDRSQFVVTIGACATTGGIQALRNMADADEWFNAIYINRSYLNSLDRVSPVHEHIKVDLELWGCPVNSRQIVGALRSLLFGVLPRQEKSKACMECKRNTVTCVLVTKGLPCMGPVTASGCGALCPSYGRDCYACFGPAENINTASLGQYFEGLGLLPEQVSHRFLSFNNAAPEFKKAGFTKGEGNE